MTLRAVALIALYLGVMASTVFAQGERKEAYMTASDGVKIHYYVLGQGTPVMLIHGYTGSTYGNWSNNGIAQALAKNHMVVAIDCRNHGKSDRPQPNGAGSRAVGAGHVANSYFASKPRSLQRQQ